MYNYNITKNIKIRIIAVVQSIVSGLKIKNEIFLKQNVFTGIWYAVLDLCWATRITTVYIVISLLSIYIIYYFKKAWNVYRVVVCNSKYKHRMK